MQEPSAFPFTMMKGAKEFLALPPSSSLAPPLSKASIVAALDALDARMQEATKNTKKKLWSAEPPPQKSDDKTPSSSEPTEPTSSSNQNNNNNNTFNLSSYADPNAMATYVTDLLAAAKELTSNETNGQQQEDSPTNMNAQDHLAALSSALHDLLLMEQNKDDSKEDHQEEQQPQDDGQQAALLQTQKEQQTPQQQANDTLTNALSDLLLLQSPRHASSSITTTGRTTPTSTTSLMPVKRRKKLALRAATSVEKKKKKHTNKEKDGEAKQDDRNTESTSAAVPLDDSEETAAASHVHNSDLMTAIDQQHPEDEECSYYLGQDVEMVKTNTFESKAQQPSVVLVKEKAIVKASPASNRRFPSRRGHNNKKANSLREPRWSAKKQPKRQQQQQHVPTAAEAHPLHILQDDGFSVEMITGENEQEVASLILQHQKELDEQSLAVSSKKSSSSNKNNNITKSAEPPVDTMASEAADTSQHSSSFTENVVQNAASAAMTPEECIDPQGQEQLPDEPYNQQTEAQVYTEEAEVDTEEAEVEQINDSSGERNDNQSVPPTSSSFPPVVDKMPSFSNGRQSPVSDVVVLPGSDSTDNSTLEYSASKSPRPSNTYQPLVMVEPKQKVMVEPKQKVVVEPKQKMRQRSSLPRRPSMLGSIRGDGGQSRNSSSSNSRRSETGPLLPKKNMRVLKMSIRRAGEKKMIESLNSKRPPFAEESAEDRNSQYVMVFAPQQQQSSRKKKVGGGKQLRGEEDNSTKSSGSTKPSSQGSSQGSAASRRLVVLNRRRTRSRRGPFMRSVHPDGKLSGSSHHRLEILSVSPSTNNGNSESSSRRRVVQEKKRPGVTTLGKKDEGAVAVLSSTKSYEVFNVNNKTKKLSNCLVVFEPKNNKDVQEPKTYRDVYEPKTNKEDVYEPRTIKEDVYEPKTNKNVYGPMTNKEEAFESSPHINNGRSQRMRRMDYADDLSIGSSTTANATTGTRMSAESQQQNSSLMMVHPRTNKKSDTYILEEQGSDTSSGILEEDAMASNGSMMEKETEAEEPSGHHASSIMGITSKRSELGSILSVVEEGEETVEDEADDVAVPETKNKRGARRTRQQLRKAQSEETDLDEALVAVISMEDLELVDNDDDEYGGGRPTTISDFIFTTVECFTCADEVEDDEVVDDFSRITPIGNHEFEEAMSRQPTLKGQPPASISDFMERRRRHRRNSLGSADDSRRFPFSVSSGISSLGFY